MKNSTDPADALDTLALIANTRALQQAFRPREDDPHHVILPPWTRRDIADMAYVQDSLHWLIAEMEAGHPWMEGRHGPTFRNVLVLNRALEEKEKTHPRKYNPNHKPAGSPNSTGGEFDFKPGSRRSPSPGSSRTRVGLEPMRRNPLFRRISDVDEDGLPNMRPRNPMDPVGGPQSPGRGNTGGLTSAEAEIQALRERALQRYLDDARQIPRGVKPVGRGTENLTAGQAQSLRRFMQDRSKYKENIEVLTYSDGRAIFSVKQPAKDIPESYAVWEKQVDSSGKLIQINKTTVGPDGELVHIKPYKK